MNFKLQIWRQDTPESEGRIETHEIDGVEPSMSFLEMLDLLNDRLTVEGQRPIEFDYDCREGICGSCCLMINGEAHGPESGVTSCQLRMRSFEDGQEIRIEPWRARSFPVVRDLVVDRSALDRIVQRGGYISVNSGSAPDANAIPVRKDQAERAFDAAQCIGCGACVAACPNSSAMLFVAAKAAHLNSLPQGEPEKDRRTLEMVEGMDAEGFGACSNHLRCEAACPKEISVQYIADLNRNYLKAALLGDPADRGHAHQEE